MNLLLIDSTVQKHEDFVHSVNANTTPMVYFPYTTREDFFQLNGPFERIAVVSYSTTLIENEPLWSDANVEFMKKVIERYGVKHIDFLACNTLEDP